MSAAVEPVAGQCDADTARQLTAQIRHSVETAYTFLREAFDRRAWAALGYSSWEAYCEEELQVGSYRLPAEMRQRAVAELTAGEKPMSNRAVATALGVHHSTVAADRAAGGGNPPPEPEAGNDVIDAEIVPDPEPAPEKVTGADGKTYPAKAPRDVPAATPRTPANQPPPRRRNRKARAEAWEHVGVVLESRAQAMQKVTDDLLAEATVEDLDHMRRHLAVLRDGAKALNAAASAVRAAVDRLHLGGAPAEADEVARRAAEERQARSDFFTGIAKALSVMGGYGAYGDYEAIKELMADYDPAELYPPQMDRYFTSTNLINAHNFTGWLIRWNDNRGVRQ